MSERDRSAGQVTTNSSVSSKVWTTSSTLDSRMMLTQHLSVL